MDNKCNDLDVRSKGKSHIAVHHVLGHAGNAGNECADSTTSLGLRGFVSEDNVPWPDRRFVAQRLLNVFHCLPVLLRFCIVSLLSCSWNSNWLCLVVLVDVFSVGHFVLSSQRRFVVPEADNERADDRKHMGHISDKMSEVSTMARYIGPSQIKRRWEFQISRLELQRMGQVLHTTPRAADC